jgi:transglutaminase-like putative cysteine protease
MALPRPAEHPPHAHSLTWVLATVALAVAVHAARLPAWLVLGTGCLLVWRWLMQRRRWKLPGRLVRLPLTAGLVAAILGHYGTVLGREAGVAFLVGLIALKLLELGPRVRDHALLIILSYFLMLAGFLNTQDLWMGAYTFALALFATAALVRLNHPGAAGGAAPTRVAAEMLAIALPLMLVLYLFFPRIHGSLWGLPTDAFGGVTGIGETMRPGEINMLSTSDEIAFRAEFDGPVPPRQRLYWRALVLDRTDGLTWRRGGWTTPPAGFTAADAPVRYTVIMEPNQARWLFLLDLPGEVPDDAERLEGYVFRAPQPVHERRRYEAVSYLDYDTGPIGEEQRRRMLVLPGDLSPRITALAREWGGGPAQIVNRALQHFRSDGFRYTLTPPILGGDPIDEFLFETRRGYCEHFAAAFVTLMRAAGVPARVVVGYQGGERNPTGGYLIVRQADAHAWAEVHLEGRGWVRVDPTSVVAPERVELGIDALRRLLLLGAPLGELSGEELRRAIALDPLRNGLRQAWLYWDAVNGTWAHWVMEFGATRQRDLLRALGFDTPGWASRAATLGSGVLLALLLAAAWVLHRRERPDPALRTYRRLCAKLARAGIECRPWDGPLAVAERVAAQHPELAEPVAGIVRAYIDIRYGNGGGRSGDRELARAVASLRVRKG